MNPDEDYSTRVYRVETRAMVRSIRAICENDAFVAMCREVGLNPRDERWTYDRSHYLMFLGAQESMCTVLIEEQPGTEQPGFKGFSPCLL
jgi:hypothetical protein